MTNTMTDNVSSDEMEGVTDVTALLTESDDADDRTEQFLVETQASLDQARAENSALQASLDSEIEAEVTKTEEAGITLLADFDASDDEDDNEQ
mgnify:CR=1 FL=1